MGWNTGGDLADEIWAVIKPRLGDGQIRPVAKELIKIFEAYDCDVMEETALHEALHGHKP